MRFAVAIAALAGAAVAAPVADVSSPAETIQEVQTFAPLMRMVQFGGALAAAYKKSPSSGGSGGKNPADEVLSTVDTDLQELGTSIDGFSAESTNVNKLQSGASKLLADIKAGQETVSSGGNIGLLDATTLLGTFQSLSSDAQSTLAGITGKKSILDKIGATSVVSGLLTQIKSEGLKLNEAIMQKLPGLAKGIGKSQYPPVDKAIGKAITALGGSGAAAAAPSDD